MKTKTFKIIMTILMLAITLCSCAQVVLATEITPIAPSDMGGVNEIAGKILGLIQAASGVAAVVLVAVFGFKFIMGSANEKAEYQKSFIPLIVGVIVVFAATSIADLLLNTFTTAG